jgi:hypothetical protein
MKGTPDGGGRRSVTLWRQTMNADLVLAAVGVLFAQREQAA